MFTSCKTNFTTVPYPLELQILLEDQTVTETAFPVLCRDYHDMDRMTWSAYDLYGKPGNSGENSNGTVHPGGNFPEKKSYLSK